MQSNPIEQFEKLSPERFPYVVRHDWWLHYPLDDIEARLDAELWLSEQPENGNVLKIRCFHSLQRASQERLFHHLEQPLRLKVISHKEWQWSHFLYSFIDMNTQQEIIGCQNFEAWCDRPHQS